MILSYSEIKKLKGIISQFQVASGEITRISTVESGRINSTNQVTISDGKQTFPYMLQGINTNVFKNVEEVMANAIAVTSHIRNKGGVSLEYVFTKDGKALFYDGSNVCRMTKFIEADVYQDITRPEDMKNLGRAVAQFSILLADFDASKLFETIPNFHNTIVRYQTLLWSMVDNLLKKKDGRVEEAKEEVEFIRRNADVLGVIVNALERHDIPLRVTHNDTKLNNVLFDKITGEPICFIDLDTVMPGTILNDMADAIRYSANTCSEDERDLSKVAIDMELLKAHLEGFKAEAPNLLTPKEIELLPTAILDMPLELGMRFLTDYFDGDVYFKINKADDNLNRARVQFRLAQSIIDHSGEIKDLVNDTFN